MDLLRYRVVTFSYPKPLKNFLNVPFRGRPIRCRVRILKCGFYFVRESSVLTENSTESCIKIVKDFNILKKYVNRMNVELRKNDSNFFFFYSF